MCLWSQDSTLPTSLQRGYKIAEIDNNDNIGVKVCFFYMKKKSSNKDLSLQVTNLGSQPFGSDALLSKLLRGLLLGRSVRFLCDHASLVLTRVQHSSGTETKSSLKIFQVTCTSTAQRGEHQIQMVKAQY